MSNGFGRHFTADLYFCQNELWKSPRKFHEEIRRVTHSLDITDNDWNFTLRDSGNILIVGKLNDSFVLMQVFPARNFIAADIFCWRPETNILNFSEGLVELFAPQVVAAETRLRAEHL